MINKGVRTMGDRSVAIMFRFLKYLLISIVIYFAQTQSVSNALDIRKSCPVDQADCVVITDCPDAHLNFKMKNNLIICGWVSDMSKVCCPTKTDIVTPEHQRNISKLSPEGCGNRQVAPSRPKYIHGVAVTEARNKWPWMVAIFRDNDKKQLCGGTLIDEEHVITAAHCFLGLSLDPKLYKVEVGELELKEDNIRYNVKEIKLHEGYRPRYYYNDIAIIRLAYPLTSFTAACLPAEDDIQNGDNVTVLGWDDLSYDGSSIHYLKEIVNIPVVGNSECDAKYRVLPGTPFPRGITNTFICAGIGEKDACQSDFGGPLLLEHSKNHWTLLGVVSFGNKCGEPGYPGIYTKVSSYLKWIENYIGGPNEGELEKKNIVIQ